MDEKLDRLFPVDDPVIVGEGQIHHGADDDLIVDDDGPLDDVVHAQDAALGRVEDRGREERAEDAAIGDGERAALHLIDGNRPCARFFGKYLQCFFDFGEGN